MGEPDSDQMTITDGFPTSKEARLSVQPGELG